MGFAAGNTVVPKGLGETHQAYYAATAGVKNFMGLRKEGVMRSTNFYEVGDPVNKEPEEEKEDN